MKQMLANTAETLSFGSDIAKSLNDGDILALTGGLGAGKTHLTKGIVSGLGSTADVTSPTFTLVHEYPDGRLPVYHFDFYRMDSAEEVLGIGWDEYLDQKGVIIVEWADLYPELLPDGTRWFKIEQKDEGRTIEEIPAHASE